MWLLHEPLGSALQTPSQKIDIKAGFEHGVFLSGQQVHEQRTDAGALEALSDKIVPRAVAAAAAAVGEQYNTTGLGWNDQRSLQLDSVDRDVDDPIRLFHGDSIHFKQPCRVSSTFRRSIKHSHGESLPQ